MRTDGRTVLTKVIVAFFFRNFGKALKKFGQKHYLEENSLQDFAKKGATIVN